MRKQKKKSWRCFHCDEVFTSRKRALEHFGSNEYEVMDPPGCVSPLRTDEKARLKEVADAIEHAMKMQRSAEANDEAEGLLQSYREEIGRLFGMVGGVKASTPHQAWLVLDAKHGELLALKEKYDELFATVNTPELIDFAKGVHTEAVHQRERWGSDHDAGKTPEDWFWLLGYLAGKALNSAKAGDVDKLKHHLITSAAALNNWHAQVLGASNMRPGLSAEAVAGATSTRSRRHRGNQHTRGNCMTEKQALQKLEDHVATCQTCKKANKRVNDFCTTGGFLFLEWTAAGAKPVSASVLSQEESAKVIDQAIERVRKAAQN